MSPDSSSLDVRRIGAFSVPAIAFADATSGKFSPDATMMVPLVCFYNVLNGWGCPLLKRHPPHLSALSQSA